MFMVNHRDFSWQYWLVSACFLSAGVAGYPIGFVLAIGLTVIQIVHFFVREGHISAFPVQVRIGYLLLLLVSLPEPMQLLYWVPTIGTWAQLIFGYCTMARIVSLMPWNLKEPFSLALVIKTFFSAPVPGNIMQGLPPVVRG